MHGALEGGHGRETKDVHILGIGTYRGRKGARLEQGGGSEKDQKENMPTVGSTRENNRAASWLVPSEGNRHRSNRGNWLLATQLLGCFK
eukprot:scaffold183738_cov33-Tisochrysis_lutea.AAC.1